MSSNLAPLRFSRLKLVSRSAAHYAAVVEDESTAMETGTAADLMILGGRPVLAYPGAVRRGEAFDQFVLDNPGALIVTKSEYAAAHGIADAVAKCYDAQMVLEGVRQQTLRWTWNGRDCRGTPDVRNDTYAFLTDLKTGETSDPRAFPWKLKRYAYHAQLAWYRHGVAIAGHPTPKDCYIVAVEQAAPHVVTVYKLTEHVLEMGEKLWRAWFEQVKVAEETQQFHGYSQSIVDLDLPDDEEIELADAVEIVSTTA